MRVPSSNGKALKVKWYVAIREVDEWDEADFDSDDEGVQAQASLQPWTSHAALIAAGWRLRPLQSDEPKANVSQNPSGNDTEPAGDDPPPTQQ